MILSIDTSTNASLSIVLTDEDGCPLASKTIAANHAQAEKLLPLVDGMLKKQGVSVRNLKKIVVADEGEGFTSLRIGIITANALGYALGISVESPMGQAVRSKKISLVAPRYHKPPSITKKS